MKVFSKQLISLVITYIEENLDYSTYSFKFLLKKIKMLTDAHQ